MKFLGFLKYLIKQISKNISHQFWLVVSFIAAIKDKPILIRLFFSRHIGLDKEKEKLNVLFVTEKWCDCNPKLGATNSEHNLFNSLRKSDLAKESFFHFDEYYITYGKAGDDSFLNECIVSQPDVIVLTWWPGTDEYFSHYNPKLSTLIIAHFILKIPIVAIWFDSADHRIMQMAEKILPFVDLSVVVDSSTAFLKYAHTPKKYLALWTPQDPSLYFNPLLTRDIEVSFVGSTYEYPERLAFLSALKQSGIDVYIDGGQRERFLSVEEYAQVFRRSQIVLNFSQGGRSAQYQQLKGRVFEATLSGALLVEQDNVETQKWFTPELDYISFTDTNDLVEKVRFYLDHPQEREKIAESGYKKASSKYTGKIFWETIFAYIHCLPN